MKFIKKSEEPEIFQQWKSQANENWQPTWDVLRAKEKRQLHQNLLAEQGFICCYCQRQISLEDSHIEHLKPKTHYPELALEYTNLLASCQGESEEPPPVPVHCGHHKKDWYDEDLLVSPLDENCEQLFTYTELGEIRPISDPQIQQSAKTTIDQLGLDIDKLRAMRREAIEAILDGFEDLTESDKHQLIEGFKTTDNEGKYTEFCMVLVYIIMQFL